MINCKLKIGEMFWHKLNRNMKLNGLMIVNKSNKIPNSKPCGNKSVEIKYKLIIKITKWFKVKR